MADKWRAQFNAHRGRAHDAYARGDFRDAAHHLKQARDMLPEGHSGRAALDQRISRLLASTPAGHGPNWVPAPPDPREPGATMSTDALDRSGVHTGQGVDNFATAIAERADRDDYVTRRGAAPS